ncbi:copper resistance protein B [Sneathiella chinensis]|uniref:Copper resistance protein CopB n=1 Tax=Sneathiella chinensis TaxID=349750 RepID=A0ABQ5U5R8_9PROT|nr:copper resistance protein B [Sneathiella chinensis]GLQ07447.1 hypothetical protein GCM10007924_26680 [Sneathiella chinensis]
MRFASISCAALGALFTAAAPLTALAQTEPLVFYGLQMEQLEYRAGDAGQDLLVWDGDAFVGTDEVRLRWEGNGEYDLNADLFESATNQLSIQVPVSDFWDVKAGIRYDSPDGPDRWHGAVGISGLAPQWIEVDSSLYVSEKGDVSADLDLEYELLLTNYLTLIPSAEMSVAFSSDRERGVGSGLNSAEVGLRLSYDLWDRMLSPYVGVAYERYFGETADFIREEGDEADMFSIVFGARLMF